MLLQDKSDMEIILLFHDSFLQVLNWPNIWKDNGELRQLDQFISNK
jgi:hypothetical protein